MIVLVLLTVLEAGTANCGGAFGRVRLRVGTVGMATESFEYHGMVAAGDVGVMAIAYCALIEVFGPYGDSGAGGAVGVIGIAYCTSSSSSSSAICE